MSLPAPCILHATTIALRRGGRWRAVMLRGPSGVGKSELALRALAADWRLVADDRTLVWRSGPALFARAPPRLFGLIEARGQGVMAVGALPFAEVVLCAELAAAPQALERMPEPRTTAVLGATLAHVALFGGDGSALARLAMAVRH